MKALLNFLMVCAMVGTMSATAVAGGDGGGDAKDDGTITVTNEFEGWVMAVVVSDDEPSTVSDFLAQGAQFVQPGDSVSFDVSGGTHTVTALFIRDVSPFDVIPRTLEVDVDNNETTEVVGVAPGTLELD